MTTTPQDLSLNGNHSFIPKHISEQLNKLNAGKQDRFPALMAFIGIKE
jgi:hypothetical protein